MQSIPLILGVTGHRDLRPADLDTLTYRVDALFEEFRTAYPQTPLDLLSSLAEGADRLVASRALRAGARVVAPLPLAPDDYLADFPTPESREEFASLLSQAQFWFVVEPIPGVMVDAPPGSRSEGYALAGAYIARNCQILIALWDGIDLGKPGGTSEVVKLHLEGESRHYHMSRDDLVTMEVGPVYQIVTPRVSSRSLPMEPAAVIKHFPVDRPSPPQERNDAK